MKRLSSRLFQRLIDALTLQNDEKKFTYRLLREGIFAGEVKSSGLNINTTGDFWDTEA